MSKIKHTAEFKIAQPAKKLFPLFSAEGEKSWVPGWDYENIMGTTNLSEDYVFLTKTHDHGSTHALLPGSPAIDAIPGGSCPLLSTDQRGISRLQGDACDIGAVEQNSGVDVYLPIVIKNQ